MKLLILDRDGVLNQHVVDPEQGTIDSPLHESQVTMLPGAASAIVRLNQLGYEVAIASNQPSAAKGKTTQKNLENVHQRIVAHVEAFGGRILSSHICWHRAEDGCMCRKPKTGLLEQAFAAHPSAQRNDSWMVGDGVSDVRAGQSLGIRTAFIGTRRCDSCRMLEGEPPTFWGSLAEFTEMLSQTAEHQ